MPPLMFYTKNSFAATVIITRKTIFITVNIIKYCFECPGYKILNSLNVIKLASEAISVPVPPMFTPRSNER